MLNQPRTKLIQCWGCASTCHGLILLAALGCGAKSIQAEDRAQTVLKTEHFDRDPDWEGHNNRIVPKHVLMVKQDFGYSPTKFAGRSAGEMGGRIQRCAKLASYSVPLSPV